MKLKVSKLVAREIIGNGFSVFVIKRVFSLISKNNQRGFEVKLKIFRKKGKIVEGKLIISKI